MLLVLTRLDTLFYDGECMAGCLFRIAKSLQSEYALAFGNVGPVAYSE